MSADIARCPLVAGGERGRCKIALSENHQFSGWKKERGPEEGRLRTSKLREETDPDGRRCPEGPIERDQVGVVHSVNAIENSTWGLGSAERQKGM